MNSKKVSICLLLAVAFQVEANNPCEGLHMVFVNDYASCSRYFSCVNGVAHPVECPDGRWFRESPPACVPPNSIECKPCPPAGITTIGVPQSCTEYTLCINGTPLDRECAPGTLFDWRLGSCSLAENVKCDYLTCPESGSAIVADPTSCEHYLVCMDGVEVARRRCADGLRFDPAIGSCSRSENVACQLRAHVFTAFGDVPTVPTVATTIPTVPTVVPTVPTAVPIPPSGQAPVPRPPNSPIPDSGVVPAWPTGPITCPRTGIHYFGHHSTCTVFQVCSHGVLHQLSCPMGQRWSTWHGACEFPDRSNCPHAS